GYKNILALSGKYDLEFNKRRLNNIRFVPATSEQDRVRKIRSFLTENVYLTGSPRNDFYFSTDAAKVVDQMRAALGLGSDQRVFLYAPTFRKNIKNHSLSDDFFRRIQDQAEIMNFVFLIKRHPKDFSVHNVESYSNIKDITHHVSGVQKLLLVADVLITDYSSIASDFCLLNKPIIFYTYDLAEYLEKQRGFYYDL